MEIKAFLQTSLQKSRAGNSLIGFPSESLVSKNERMSDLVKKMSHSLLRSFLVSDLSDSLTLLTKKEGISESLIKKKKKLNKK